MQKSCERCLWFERCRESEPCEYFTPLTEDDCDEASEEEYRQDLDSRAELYRSYVLEQFE